MAKAKKKHCYDYPRPMVTVDCVALRVVDSALEILLVKRGTAPFKGFWALPGGFVGMKETLEAAAIRELVEETGVRNLSLLFQHGVYGDPGRDPRGRVITVAFMGVVAKGGGKSKAGDEIQESRWFSVEKIPGKLACDHANIICDAMMRLAAHGKTSALLIAFLGDAFSAGELRKVLEAVYGVRIDPDDFLTPFIERKVVRRMNSGKFKFLGWHTARGR